MKKKTKGIKQYVVGPEILISELSRIGRKNFFTESELFYATNLLRQKKEIKQMNIVLDVTSYSIERTLRYNYRFFDLINDIIIVKKSAEIETPDYIRKFIDLSLKK